MTVGDSKLIVVALGGNAITPPDGPADIVSQFEQTNKTAQRIAELIVSGHRVVLTHGNGPQVGAVMRRVEIAASQVYPLPLEVCVADTQGGMGYMISQCLSNELRRRGLDMPVTTIVTTVEVDAEDSDFLNPTKPIGAFYNRQTAERHRQEDGWLMKEVSKGKFRRVVASPKPMHIVEKDAIKTLVNSGHLIIACGGGGVPVIVHDDGRREGIAAVVDKDWASALLADEIDADCFVVLTAVEKVCIDYEQPTQRALSQMTVAQAKQFLQEGQFPAGSMGPKIEAATSFLEKSTQENSFVVITDMYHLLEGLIGQAGTRIVRK